MVTFHIIKLRKHYIIIVASCLIEYCHTGNFGFPVLILSLLPRSDSLTFGLLTRLFTKATYSKSYMDSNFNRLS